MLRLVVASRGKRLSDPDNSHGIFCDISLTIKVYFNAVLVLSCTLSTKSPDIE